MNNSATKNSGDVADLTPPKQRGVPFKPGQSGNPAGRPRGSRNKLAADFIDALHEKFQEYGIQAIEKVAKDEPATFLKIVAGLLPRETVISALSVTATANFGQIDLMDAEEFAAAWNLASSIIGAQPMIDLQPEPEPLDATDGES
jgi:Family of unknown function (DUF5681)